MLRLTDEQWERIREHFPEENIPADRPGRRPVPKRQVLEAVLWILNTGAQWHMLPQCYPNYKTVHRRFQQWCEREILRAVWPIWRMSFAIAATLTRASASLMRRLRVRRVVARRSPDPARQRHQDHGHR